MEQAPAREEMVDRRASDAFRNQLFHHRFRRGRRGESAKTFALAPGGDPEAVRLPDDRRDSGVQPSKFRAPLIFRSSPSAQ